MARTALILVLIAAVTPMLQAGAAPCVERLPRTQVKAADPTHRALLRQGIERSTTFRHLIADLEASAWLVFVQTGRCPEKLAVACLLHFVGRFDGQPYLRVIVRHEPRHPDNVIAILAHELQHAREVVQGVGVTDAGGLRDLFRRIGRVSVDRPGVVTYETERGVQVEKAVWRELARAPRHACRCPGEMDAAVLLRGCAPGTSLQAPPSEPDDMVHALGDVQDSREGRGPDWFEPVDRGATEGGAPG